MTEFWWGILALPLIALSVAAAAAALFGAWLLYEKWVGGRLEQLAPIDIASAIGSSKFPLRTATRLGARGRLATMMLLANKAGYFRVSPNLAIAFVTVQGIREPKEIRAVQTAIEKTIDDLTEQDSA